MKFIIHRKIFISMLFLGLTILGYVSYKRLPVELMPNAELPMLFVQVQSRIEVDPKYMENQAVIPVEIIGDTLSEADETFFLDVFNPVGGSFGEDVVKLTAVRTIVNDDGRAWHPFLQDFWGRYEAVNNVVPFPREAPQ
jgi:hypothetical protein